MPTGRHGTRAGHTLDGCHRVIFARPAFSARPLREIVAFARILNVVLPGRSNERGAKQRRPPAGPTLDTSWFLDQATRAAPVR